jgi:hypothetical protein
MKKREVDHVLRAAGRITGEKQFIIIGSQSLHGKFPDLADDLVKSFEVDLMAAKHADRTELLNVIGMYSPFHGSFGYYADPVDHKTATLPKGWKGRLVNLPAGDTEGVRGLCLDPHDLAIAKYVARRDKDIIFTRELAKRGIVSHDRLLELLDQTPVSEETRDRIRVYVAGDFGAQNVSDGVATRGQTEMEPIPTRGSLSLEEIRALARKDWLRLREQRRGESLSGEADRSHGQERNDPPKDHGIGFDDDTTG